MPRTTLLVGQPDHLRRLEGQLDLVADRPSSLGWVLAGADVAAAQNGDPVLGAADALETIVAAQRPEVVLICLPARFGDLVARLRTRLRRLGVAERFIPTLEDLLDGIGPRSEIDVDVAALLPRPPRTPDPASLRAVLAGKRVMVTGAGGSIGSELARIVAASDPALLLLVERSENALFEIDRQILRRRPELPRRAILHDVVDAEGTTRIFREHRPEVVFHAAAHKHVPMMEDHPAAAVDNNLFGTRSVVDAAAAAGTARFVMISTDKAVRPASIMGATKRLAELYVQHVNRRSATRFSMVRFGNVLGSSGSVLDQWAKQIRDGGPVTVTDPAMTRYFMTIPEAAGLVIESALLVGDAVGGGEVFLLDMGDPVPILGLAEAFIRAHGLEPRLPGAAAPADAAGHLRIAITGARPGEKVHEELSFDDAEMDRTSHPGILAWRVRPPARDAMERILSDLAPHRRPSDPTRLAELIRSLTPGAAATQVVEIKDVLAESGSECARISSRSACTEGSSRGS